MKINGQHLVQFATPKLGKCRKKSAQHMEQYRIQIWCVLTIDIGWNAEIYVTYACIAGHCVVKYIELFSIQIFNVYNLGYIYDLIM